MNTPQPTRTAGNRDRTARHARAGPEPVLSTIPQQPGPETEDRMPPGQLPQPQTRDVRIARRAVRSWRYLLPLFAGGTLATAISAVRAFGWTIEARPGAGPWLITAVLAGLGTATLSAITCIYRDRQETRRIEIEQRRTEILATAFARALDATHTKAQNLSGAKEMTEAARVRDSAREVTAILAPAMVIPFHDLSPVAKDRPEAAGMELGQLIDPVRAN
jgi:hypothetical protein